ncbi:MAG: hypothetical protein HY532_08955 [Chloroflexi bacterium]|nr:hypothetical protein [Chloroflexota bacterium]
MTATSSGSEAWICPACGWKKQSLWALSCHIVSMRDPTYNKAHKGLIETLVPDVVWGQTFSEAHQLMPKLRLTVRPTVLETVSITVEPSVEAYILLARIETKLHTFIIDGLWEKFGEDEKEWWARHVPLPTRKECSERREQDPKRLPLHRYMDLIDLKSVIEKNWDLFQSKFPSEYGDNRKLLLQDFDRLNQLRNEVMHPLRGQQWDEDDIQFVRSFLEHVNELDL